VGAGTYLVFYPRISYRFYVESGRSFTFHELQMWGRVRREIVIGYRHGNDAAVLNPLGKRDQRITLRYIIHIYISMDSI
jgi:hypothetical protein